MADPTQTLRRELLDDTGVFADLAAAQAAVDAFRQEYNTDRPHQSLDMAFPADRFRPGSRPEPVVALKLPRTLSSSADDGQVALRQPPRGSASVQAGHDLPAPPAVVTVGAVEFDRVVPPSGNLQVAGKQFWLGPARSGVTVTFWADPDVIHLLIAGARVKSVRSHLSVADLAVLRRHGGRPAGPPPLPPADRPDSAVEVDRTVNRYGGVSLGHHTVLAAEILGGRRVGIRIDPQTLTFFDLDTRELLRTRPNPLTAAEVARLRGTRPAGPPSRPSTEPVQVQRRASATGVIMVAGQNVALGRVHAGKTVTIAATDTHLEIACDDGVRTVRRTTDHPVRWVKGQRPRNQEPADQEGTMIE